MILAVCSVNFLITAAVVDTWLAAENVHVFHCQANEPSIEELHEEKQLVRRTRPAERL